MADITLPQLGETVTEGTITRWFKKVGDSVSADEPLFEVSTDKVDTEVPSPIAGTVTEIRAAEGDTIAVGTVVAIVGPAGATVVSAPAPTPAPTPPAPAPTPPSAPIVTAPSYSPPAESAPSAPRVQAVVPTAAPVASAAPANVAQPSTNGGNRLLSPVVRRLVSDHRIDVNALVGTGPGGRITREDVLDYIDRHGLVAQPAPPSAAPSAPAPVAAPVAAPAPAAPSAPAPVAAPAPAPAAARPAPAAAASAPTPASGQRDTVVPLTKIRRLTGAHMVMSKATSPHAFSVVEVDYANVDRARGKVKSEWKSSEGFSLTYLPFISRAVVDALRDFPHLNASISGDDLIVHQYVDLGVAVDLDYQGLLVPVVRDADGKRLRAIAREINDLATRARARKVTPDEIQGATFTLTNNGSAGSVLTMPIINQPQVAILSTDAIVRRPVVVATADGGEAIAVHPVGHLSMAWDHRAFDGAYAGRFLLRVKEILETQDWSAEI